VSGLVELSHPIEDGMTAYPWLPAARIGAILDHDASRERYDGGPEFYIGRSAPPLAIRRGASAPVRAYAEIPA
jgi:kynurenine formamidase